jgi:hypothetical protein
MDRSCVKGFLASLNVPSTNHCLEDPRMESWSSVAKMRWRLSFTLTSILKNPASTKSSANYRNILLFLKERKNNIIANIAYITILKMKG